MTYEEEKRREAVAKHPTPLALFRFLVGRGQEKRRLGRRGSVTIDVEDAQQVLEVLEAVATLLGVDENAGENRLTRTESGMYPTDHDFARAIGTLRTVSERERAT